MTPIFDCIPCFLRQTLEAARMVSTDPSVHEKTLKEVLHLLATMDLNQSPAIIAQRVHRLFREVTGVEDPYRNAKDRQNRLALTLLEELKSRIETAINPLTMAIRLAIAGNIIDMGIRGDLTEDSVRVSIGQALEESFIGNLYEFRESISNAGHILYLTDNAGEIAFDRLLIEQISPAKVTVAVRGAPVLNDATMVDAYAVGLNEIVEVIENGSDAPGTLLNDCSEDFRRRFDGADLIIAKGQGNFKTLSDNPSNIFFLFKAKCPVVAALIGVPLGTQILRHTNSEIGKLRNAS